MYTHVWGYDAAVTTIHHYEENPHIFTTNPDESNVRRNENKRTQHFIVLRKSIKIYILYIGAQQAEEVLHLCRQDTDAGKSRITTERFNMVKTVGGEDGMAWRLKRNHQVMSSNKNRNAVYSSLHGLNWQCLLSSHF